MSDLRHRARAILPLLIVFALGSACTTTPPKIGAGVARQDPWLDPPAGAGWRQMAQAALNTDGQFLLTAMPRDMTDFCPRYVDLGPEARLVFWTTFLEALSKAESANDPRKQAFHLFDSDAGRPVIRRGLLQISIESAKRKLYKCGVKRLADLADPESNIECAVKILVARIQSDGEIAGATHAPKGAARYWHSLTDRRHHALLLEDFRAVPGCLGS